MYVSHGNPSPQHNSIRHSRYGFRGMRVSDNQSPVTRGNGCRTTRLPHGKSHRIVRGPRMACSLVAVFVVLTAVCAAGSEPKRVLIVHSFGSVAPPFTRGRLCGAIPGPPVSENSHPLHWNGSTAFTSRCARKKRRFHWGKF